MKKVIIAAVVGAITTIFLGYIFNASGYLVRQAVLSSIKEDKTFQETVAELVRPRLGPAEQEQENIWHTARHDGIVTAWSKNTGESIYYLKGQRSSNINHEDRTISAIDLINEKLDNSTDTAGTISFPVTKGEQWWVGVDMQNNSQTPTPSNIKVFVNYFGKE